jgi:hypothetical protein
MGSAEYDGLAQAAAGAGDNQAAVDAYQKTIELWPKNDPGRQDQIDVRKQQINILERKS